MYLAEVRDPGLQSMNQFETGAFPTSKDVCVCVCVCVCACVCVHSEVEKHVRRFDAKVVTLIGSFSLQFIP